MTPRTLTALLSTACLTLVAGAQEPLSPRAYTERLNEVPTAEMLRAWHDQFASEPHDAGTPGDAKVIAGLAAAFESFGFEVQEQELLLYLPAPVIGDVSIIAGDRVGPPLVLPTREEPVDGDSFSGRDEARPGWNAWSGSGDVTGEVVYANYGTREDFIRLRELGVDVSGKVAIARYGGNFRGYKAKYAEEAGAAGLLIYTDPEDSGWGRGLSWPDGGYANGSHIQRGSLKTLDYAGDALTPFEPATERATRLNPDTLALPRIPVQPIGWDAASEILARMAGQSVPDAWQGGLPFRYRLEGGEGLRVRVRVEQTRELVRTANVIATMRGAIEPERSVIIGCHHDAWGFGAGDAMAGMICLLESARAIGELAASGSPPARTIVFAGWAAEEHGIIGSTEYVEANIRELTTGGVAYVNLDMAAMGPDFSASSSPSLRSVVTDAAGQVPQARDSGRTVLDANDGSPSISDLGGGSDHVGFLCHACIPSVGLRGGGSPGVSYHSNYDNLDWYRAVVGDDYEPALMIARMTNAIVARLANSPVLPLDATAYPPRVSQTLAEAFSEASAIAMTGDAVSDPVWQADGAGLEWETDAELIARINDELTAMERGWCAIGADDGRPWYRNAYVAPDATSGYASWVLPGVQRGLLEGDRVWADREAHLVAAWSKRLRERSLEVARMIEDARRQQADEVVAPDPRSVVPD